MGGDSPNLDKRNLRTMRLVALVGCWARTVLIEVGGKYEKNDRAFAEKLGWDLDRLKRMKVRPAPSSQKQKDAYIERAKKHNPSVDITDFWDLDSYLKEVGTKASSPENLLFLPRLHEFLEAVDFTFLDPSNFIREIDNALNDVAGSSPEICQLVLRVMATEHCSKSDKEKAALYVVKFCKKIEPLIQAEFEKIVSSCRSGSKHGSAPASVRLVVHSGSSNPSGDDT